jgi:hypothetical protein
MEKPVMTEISLSSGGFQASRPLVFLVLYIAGSIYEVRRFAPDHPLARTGVRLRKLPTGTVYEVAIVGPSPHCSCPDFIFRRKDENEKCKHILALEHVLFLHPTAG